MGSGDLGPHAGIITYQRWAPSKHFTSLNFNFLIWEVGIIIELSWGSMRQASWEHFVGEMYYIMGAIQLLRFIFIISLYNANLHCSVFWASLSIVLLLSSHDAQQMLLSIMLMLRKRFLEMLKDRVILKSVMGMDEGKCVSPEIKIRWYLEFIGKGRSWGRLPDMEAAGTRPRPWHPNQLGLHKKYCRLGSFNNRNLFSLSLEAGSSKSRCR